MCWLYLYEYGNAHPFYNYRTLARLRCAAVQIEHFDLGAY